MKILYKEMQERLKFLEAQEQTEENKWRIQEITLAIVRASPLLEVHKFNNKENESINRQNH